MTPRELDRKKERKKELQRRNINDKKRENWIGSVEERMIEMKIKKRNIKKGENDETKGKIKRDCGRGKKNEREKKMKGRKQSEKKAKQLC